MLSHRAAAAVHGLRYFDLLEVTVPRYRVRPGIDVHVSRLERDEWSCVDGVPVTGVSRTLFDLAAVLPPHHVERAFNEALVQGLSDTLSVPALIRRYPARRGVRAIRPLLQADAHLTRSELEVRFLGVAKRAGLPIPRANASVLGLECDFVWDGPRVIVELDGYATHRTAAAFERDRARDRALHAAGWRVVRITWQQLRDERETLAADLRAILRVPARRRRVRARAAGP